METRKTITTVLGKEIELTEKMWFVTCTDKFLSGWGRAEGKIAKRICICKDHAEAEKLRDRMERNKEKHMLRYINAVPTFPYYSPNKYTVSIDVYSDNIYC